MEEYFVVKIKITRDRIVNISEMDVVLMCKEIGGKKKNDVWLNGLGIFVKETYNVNLNEQQFMNLVDGEW